MSTTKVQMGMSRVSVRVRIIACASMFVLAAAACSTEIVVPVEVVDSAPTAEAVDPAPEETQPADETPWLTAAEISDATVTDYPLWNAALSPDGRYLFGASFDSVSESESTWCLVDLESSVSWDENCTTGAVDRGFPDGVMNPVWSPDSTQVAWTGHDDIWRLSIDAMIVQGVTDDGIDDTSFAVNSDGVFYGATVAHDRSVAWIGNEQLAFVRNDQRSEPRVVSLTIVDVRNSQESVVVGPTYETTFRDNVRVRSVWGFTTLAPFILDSRTVIVGAEAQVHEIDLRTFEVQSLLDIPEFVDVQNELYSDFGFQTSGQLDPLVMSDDGVIVWDQAVRNVLYTERYSGSPSAAYFVGNDGGLDPLFAVSDLEGGYIGPLAVGVSPSSTMLVVYWIDDSERGPRNLPTTRLSLLDLETVELPVDPRELSELWSAPDRAFSPRNPVITWSENDRIVVTDGEATFVLQLEN